MTITDASLGQRIYQELLHEQPRVDDIIASISADHDIEKEDASEVLTQLVYDINRKRFMPLRKAELILVEGCNLACTYCFESKFLNTQLMRRRLMDTGVIHKAIDLLFAYSGDRKKLEITLFGGEPTLHMRGIRETVDYAGKLSRKTGKTVKYDMTSNGVLFTPEMVDYFANAGIMVLLSIDGTRQVHDKYRLDKSGFGTYDAVLRGMDLLKTVQPWIGTKMTVMPDAAATLFESIQYLYHRGVNQFVIGHATGENWTHEAIDIYAREMEQATSWYRQQAEKHGNIRITQFDEDVEDKRGGIFGCGAGRNTIAVEVSGKITGCSRISTVEDHAPTGLLGDVEHGLYCLNMRQEMNGCTTLQKNCCDKGIEKDYRGGCFATNHEMTGNMFSPNITEHEMSLKVNSVNE